MKAKYLTTIAGLNMAASLLTTSTTLSIATAAENPNDSVLVPKVLELHAPNSATPSVTIWVPSAAIPKAPKIPVAKTREPKEIRLHAPNGPTQSVTVWPN